MTLFGADLPDPAADDWNAASSAFFVPKLVFRANMSPDDLVSMLESYYRIRNDVAVFESKAVQPVQFLGKQGLRFDYDYVAGGDVKHRGRAVIAISDEKLYMIALDAMRLHYFDAALPEFDRMAENARLGG